MKIIAIMPGHNSTVALFINNECRGIFHEEKFLDVKNYTGFPKKAFEHILKLSEGKFDKIVFTQDLFFSVNLPNKLKTPIIDFNDQNKKSLVVQFQNFLEIFEYFIKTNFLVHTLRNLYIEKIISPKYKSKILNYMYKEYNISKENIYSFDHHLCHCVTPVAFFGLEKKKKKFLLFSMDGAGDKLFSKVCTFDPIRREIKVISKNQFQHSLGLYYLEMTKFLGMKPNEHEYKVMGLSAYVDNEEYYKHIYERLKNLIIIDEDTLTFKSKLNANTVSLYFKEHFAFERFDNLAAAIQKLTSELLIKWVVGFIKKTEISNIACSGGVFMNIKINKSILDLKKLETCYIQPSCGDDSLPIGAAYLLSKKLGKDKWSIQ